MQTLRKFLLELADLNSIFHKSLIEYEQWEIFTLHLIVINSTMYLKSIRCIKNKLIETFN